ncbi:thiopeptide-type bacteriocin biosynthesis domain-containing protein [Marininema mesophilum]|uniref:Thiopeptide-type bacteriocin biosynthesis domain-containing protein n=1 Tax=Marininema mesophilum TaxID=1048340 RepID=A0A1H3AI83_9BACL|nr:lantibiotic dehydratase [Marininema mesophilum]SDX29151.1 thiopeptide-type bacteriocin biosynthesis domain-containing protein [Marininema mesophilum]
MYEPINAWMLRTPTWPIEKFNALTTDKTMPFQQLLLKTMDKTFIESIAIASPSLYEDLSQLEGDSHQRKTKQVVASVLKYATRMSTRPTPFGLFAGVTVGELSEGTTISLQSSENHIKRARPDMEWLLTLIEKLEEDIEGIQQIKVYKNQLVTKSGGRLYLPYQTGYGRQTNITSKKERVSIQLNEAALQVLKASREPIVLSELIARISSYYSNFDPVQIRTYILQLLKQEFLISELRPPLTISNPFHYIINQIKDIPRYHDVYLQLVEIDQLLEDFNASPMGEGIEIYLDVIQKMKSINETKAYLQVDLGLKNRELTLNQAVADEAAKAATILWRISQTEKGLPHLKKYRDRFLDRYGRDREVPILELLSEESGLGSPEEYYPDAPSTISEPRNSEREQRLLEMMQTALLNRQYVVQLDAKALKDIIPPSVDDRDAPSTVELYTEVLAKSAKAVDDGEFTLVIAPNPGSGSAGQTFGRFFDVLDPFTKNKLQAAHKEINDAQPDVITADCVYFPTRGRAANVSLAPGLQEYELVLGTNYASDKKKLFLEDIVVGATLERLYFKSVSLGKEVTFTANNMLNFQSSPGVYRFLREVSLENVRIWHSYEWGTLRDSPFLPRVQVDKTILSPAKWKLSMGQLELKKEASVEEWNTAFDHWLKKWMVPRFVYMGATDQRLLLDLEHPAHRKEIIKAVENKGRVHLSESFYQQNNDWIVDADHHHYIGEFVFPLKKREALPHPSPVTPVMKKLASNSRIKLPGSDCLYIKVYMAKSRQNDFISRPLSHFVKNAREEGLVQRWFFMRYGDPDNHLRIRFFGEPERLIASLIPTIHTWAERLVEEGLIQKLTIDAYDPEFERYGGPQLIHHAERVFEADSDLVAYLVNQIRFGKIEFPEEFVASMNMLDFMEQYGLNFEDRLLWLDQMVQPDEHRKEFQLWRRAIVECTLHNPVWAQLLGVDQEIIKGLADKRNQGITEFKSQMERIQEQNLLWNHPHKILGSMLHMTCNRLMGDNSKEMKARAFARHALYSQQYLRKQLVST